MTYFVASLGFSTEPVVRPIMGHGIADGDTIVLVHPEQDSDENDRVENVVTDIKGTFQTIGDNVSIERHPIKIDPFRAIKNISTCLWKLSADEDVEEVVAVLGGGSNEVVIGLTAATLVHLDRIAAVQMYGNAQSASFEIDLPRLIAQMPLRAEDTFTTIVQVDEPLSVSEVAAATEQSISTAGRHVDALESEQLVTTTQEGGERLVQPTTTAQLLLDASVVTADSDE